MGKIANGEIDPSFIITHRIPIHEAPEAYKTFRDKKDGCIKVVIKPGMDGDGLKSAKAEEEFPATNMAMV